jgi:hypothetical protein
MSATPTTQPQDLPELCAAVAHYLDLAEADTWTLRVKLPTIEDSRPDYYLSATATTPELELSIHPYWKDPSRLYLSGHIESKTLYDHSGSPFPSITVDRSRPPQAIAREILRRLLPAWRPFLAEAQQLRDAYERRVAQMRLIANRLIQLGEGRIQESLSQSRPDRIRLYAPGQLDHIEIYSPNSIEIKATLKDAAAALALSQVILASDRAGAVPACPACAGTGIEIPEDCTCFLEDGTCIDCRAGSEARLSYLRQCEDFEIPF